MSQTGGRSALAPRAWQMPATASPSAFIDEVGVGPHVQRLGRPADDRGVEVADALSVGTVRSCQEMVPGRGVELIRAAF